MPWDGDNQNDKGPWGQPPKGKSPQNNRPTPNQPDDIDEIIRKSQEKIKEIFSGVKKGGGGSGGDGKGNGGDFSPVAPFKVFAIVGVLLAGLWLASGFYTVNPKEVGVVLRFGKYVRTTKPGVNYHLPTPIEYVIKLQFTDRYRTQIGNNSNESNGSAPRRRRGDVETTSRKEILMLTGDENIVSVEFVEIQWQIDDPEKFLFQVYDPEKTVRDTAESAMREVVGTTPLREILSDGRGKVQLDTKALLQSVLDSYGSGIKIEEINMSAVPPKTSIVVDNITTDDSGEMKAEKITTTVDEAFKDVQAAIINKEESINSAKARSNELIPQARGGAEQLLQQAEGYKQQVIAKAEGEAKRFISVYDEYKNAKDVTKRRIYLETMEEILKGMDKIVLDSKGGVVPYLPLNELNSKR
jgi:membrane protease subunit HflK